MKNKSIDMRKKNAGKWLADALNPAHKGLLHETLHIPAGQKIPIAKLKKAAKGGNNATARRARLAMTMRTFNH